MKKIPAGIIEGIEAFWFDNEKWIIAGGMVMRFDEAPVFLQNYIVEIFRHDERSRNYLDKLGEKGFSKQFDMWYRCVVGALDETPDFADGNLNADAYNHACTDYKCPHRGKLCSLTAGLKNYEVESLAVLKQGKTIKQAAGELCISIPGLKSRVEKLKEKLKAENMAQLIAKAVEFGI